MAATVFAGLGALAAAPASASSPAAYTGVNDTYDSPGGHCLHGSATNCNAYDGQQYVWLNAGPSTAQLPAGDYFFAVLSPGGQADPNDGSLNNLSSDPYTDRTFSVDASGTITNDGTHVLDSNKLQLAPYKPTTNAGGVYILAICSLTSAGQPVLAGSCKYDAFKVVDSNTGPAVSEPTVTKDAAGSYDTTWTWGITKQVDKTTINTTPSGTATFTYTVSVTHDAGVNSAVSVAGTIDVQNPNFDSSFNTVPVTLSGLTDQLSDNTVCTIDTSGGLTLNAFDNYYTYSCTLNSLPQAQLDNTVTATWAAQDVGGSNLPAGSASFTFTGIDFTQTAIDNAVTVTDTYGGTLGRVTASDPSPTRFVYSHGFTGDPVGTCTNHTNMATYTTSTTSTTGSASKTVSVCIPPAATGALTMGFWQNKNGQGIISGGGSTAGVCNSGTWLRGFAPFQNLSTAATCAAVASYVYTTIKAATCTSTTKTCNTMLKAQMLATALDVYFSDPTLGGNKIGAPSPIGAQTIDLTHICKMIDGSGGVSACSAAYENVGAAFGGVTSLSVLQMLTYAASQSNVGGSTWYAQVKATQVLAKDAFDAINNRVAFNP